MDYKKLVQDLKARQVKESEFNAKCETAIGRVEATVKRIDELDKQVES